MRMDGHVVMRTTKVKIKKQSVIKDIDVKKPKERIYRSSVVIPASKEYATWNIFELKFLDFPWILRQNDNTQIFFWPGMPFVKYDDFCLIAGQLEIMLWVKMIRSLVYNLRTRWFYESKL